MRRAPIYLTLAVLTSAAVLLASRPAAAATKMTVAVTGFHCQACPDTLAQDLAKLPGVKQVQATLAPARVVATLDEQKMPASRFVQAIATHPQAMDPAKTYGAGLVLQVDAAMCKGQKTMCPACAPEITKRLKAVKGVQAVAIDGTGRVVTVRFAQGAAVTTAQLQRALAASSFKFSVRFA